ncbi:MAG: hypothetical protein CM1200mP4_0290 [Rhodospirillaceae bacterium]|nr:MAG: hypothetical protein CM1200mP4_0290 [Rhodospirillaceae bacterium]
MSLMIQGKQNCPRKNEGSNHTVWLAQIEAGADALTVPGHATGDLLAESTMIVPQGYACGVVDLLPVPLILHICGRTVDR